MDGEYQGFGLLADRLVAFPLPYSLLAGVTLRPNFALLG